MTEKIVQFSLDDERSKHIAEALSNKTSQKILDKLTEKVLTVSDISQELKIPLNTADYNVKKLLKAGLIEKSSHFWSTRGKKMPTYKISNQKIIISPSKLSKFKTLGLTVLLTGLSALIVNRFTNTDTIPRKMLENSIQDSAVSMLASPESAQQTINITQYFLNLSPASWFLIGAWFAVLIFFIITLVKGEK